jgi:hypothetical protein
MSSHRKTERARNSQLSRRKFLAAAGLSASSLAALGQVSRGVSAAAMSAPGSVILPAAESVINKRARHPDWPSFTSPEGRAIKYGPETCRQTRDIFDRFVMIRMGPKYTDRMAERIVKAIREVHEA